MTGADVGKIFEKIIQMVNQEKMQQLCANLRASQLE